MYYVLKALLPVCMKYTARGESRVANIARGEAKCYICHETLTKSCIFHTNSISALSVLLYFTPINVRIKHSSLIVLNKVIQINGFL